MPISQFIVKFIRNPINVSVDRDYFRFNLTFPTLTLCLHDRINETALQNFIKNNSIHDKNRQLETFLKNLIYFDSVGLEKLTKYRKIQPDRYLNVRS